MNPAYDVFDDEVQESPEVIPPPVLERQNSFSSVHLRRLTIQRDLRAAC